jgi:cell wall-associated NlpC family hydrolase
MRFLTATVHRTCAIALIASLALGPVAAFAAPAPPSALPVTPTPQTQAFQTKLQARQAALAKLQADLDSLDLQMEVATEAYNGAEQQLTDTQAKLTASRSGLGAAQDALDAQTKLLDTRIDAMYRDGTASTAEILLTAKSIPDFFQRIQFITAISSADAGVSKELGYQRDAISTQETGLEQAALQAQSLEFEARAKKLEISYQIQARQQMLASAQSGLVAMLGKEAVARDSNESALLGKILSGAKDIGISVVPGSPVETILSYHGIPYVWGGATPAGFDCSGLTMYVMAQHGVTLPHHAADQALLGTPVSLNALEPGDLVFFGSPIHHVGMYIGGGYFVEAPHTGAYVQVSVLAGRDPVCARRYPWRYRVGPPLGVKGVSAPKLPGK